MISSIGTYFTQKFKSHTLLSKEQRDKRFPKCDFQIHPMVVRKIGISANELSPLSICEMIEKYYHNLDPSNHRYVWLTHWLPLIQIELNVLNKYTMEDVGRIVIIQNEKVIFDFYLIYDIHIHDVETIVINLNNVIEEPSYFSKIITSISMVVSIGSLGYFLSNMI